MPKFDDYRVCYSGQSIVVNGAIFTVPFDGVYIIEGGGIRYVSKGICQHNFIRFDGILNDYDQCEFCKKVIWGGHYGKYQF